MKTENKKNKYNFPSVKYGTPLDEIRNIISEHGGVYVIGFCIIRSVERKTTTRFVDGIISKSKNAIEKKISNHIIFSGSRAFVNNLKELKK